jgi:monoterpene epsilon-lactone hydrolase
MPSLRGRFFNAYIRRFVRRRYGMDKQRTARQARKHFGAPRFWQFINEFGVSIRRVVEQNISGEWIEPKQSEDGMIFYVHGGGYISCSPATHRPISATLARKSRLRVFSLDYPLAPENPFPAALDNVFSAYRWLLAQNISPEKIALAGDSAGGGLILALLLRLRDANLPLPACAVCFSPWTDVAGTSESIRTNAGKCAMFYPENIQEFANAFLADDDAANPYISPVFGDYTNFPPILFHVGSTEILLDDARRVHQKILGAGGASEIEIYDDIFHCWQMGAALLPEAMNSLTKAAEFIRRNISALASE